MVRCLERADAESAGRDQDRWSGRARGRALPASPRVLRLGEDGVDRDAAHRDLSRRDAEALHVHPGLVERHEVVARSGGQSHMRVHVEVGDDDRLPGRQAFLRPEPRDEPASRARCSCAKLKCHISVTCGNSNPTPHEISLTSWSSPPRPVPATSARPRRSNARGSPPPGCARSATSTSSSSGGRGLHKAASAWVRLRHPDLRPGSVRDVAGEHAGDQRIRTLPTPGHFGGALAQVEVHGCLLWCVHPLR